ncbi:nucleotidyltransferase domain-containing protein [Bacteroidales bacterium OttesenSCG-928-L03]|nr:nucleotidyltransferase domain-containing protein [Bacteroidales bacterium OttesenSCG-928-L03]
MNYLSQYIPQIVRLCQKYKVKKLFAFGSVLTDSFGEESDVDLIVSFDKEQVDDYFLNYFDFKYSLESIFKRKVDLMEEQPIRNPFLRQSIEQSKTLIYG